jgi:hypothetical protein
MSDFLRKVTVGREQDHDLRKYPEIPVEFEEGEIVTVSKLRNRLSDQLNLSASMVALVDGDVVSGSTVLEDGQHVHFKMAANEKG